MLFTLALCFSILLSAHANCYLNCVRNECSYHVEQEESDDKEQPCVCLSDGNAIKIVDKLRLTSLKQCQNVQLV